MTEHHTVDRADIAIRRALNCGWITFNTSTAHAQFHATLRIALNMEVEAGGPYPVYDGGEPRAAEQSAPTSRNVTSE